MTASASSTARQEARRGRSDEFALIARHFAPLAGRGAFGLLDDAALLQPPAGRALVVTQDALAAGVHFFPDDPPELIARKALRVNLSDLAAKGATPLAVTLALGLPDDWTDGWVAGFAAGLGEDLAAHGVGLLGGDTFRSPERAVLSVTAFGVIAPENYRSRLAGSPGETLWVTGTIGDAALGLDRRRALGPLEDDPLVRAYLLPDPPIAFAPAIAELASAAMDLSDGFAGDCMKLLAASGLSADIPVAAVPLSDAVRSALEAGASRDTVLTGGDDYQILFTAPASAAGALHQRAAALGIRLTRLADVRAGGGALRLLGSDGQALELARPSWDHFSQGDQR